MLGAFLELEPVDEVDSSEYDKDCLYVFDVCVMKYLKANQFLLSIEQIVPLLFGLT